MANIDMRRASQQVSHDRLNGRLAEMASIGATPNGGVNRQALTDEDAQAQCLLARWGAEAGMTALRDEVGNLYLSLPGSDPALPPVMTGSHMDTQPTGGRFDGIYGVMAGLEAIFAIAESGRPRKRNIELVAWVNEEGSRFAPSLMGSGVYAGVRSVESVLALRDLDGVTVAQALERIESRLAHIGRRPVGGPVHAYVEAHIEQGPLLEQTGDTIGVVTGIQGKHTYRVTVRGEAAHAGTAPLRERRDALLAATAIIQELSRQLDDPADIVRFTVGRFIVSPNAPSVVASEAVFSIDLRHPDPEKLQAFSDRIPKVCAQHAGNCAVEVERLYTAEPLTFSAPIQDMIADAASHLGISSRSILSAAGHDAGLIQRICPTGMIFVPSIDGITHNEAEFSRPEDLTEGTRVLADVLDSLASQP